MDHDQDSDSPSSTPPPVPPRVGQASLRPDFSNSSRHGGPNSVEISQIADSNRTNASDANVSISNGIDNSTATKHGSDNAIANGSVPLDSEANQSNASPE